jgi:hypothetical protein
MLKIQIWKLSPYWGEASSEKKLEKIKELKINYFLIKYLSLKKSDHFKVNHF